MTELLYLHDSYLKEREATVVKVTENKIVLNQTIFYYTSGGQPHDTGIITKNKETSTVLNVYRDKETNEIIHEVDKPGLKEQDKVHLKIDWSRRYQHMRGHTAMHILSRVISEDIKDFSTGNQIGQDQSRIDFALKDFNVEKAKEYIEKTNQTLDQDHKVAVSFLKREEMLKDPELFRLKNILPKDIETFRIVAIGAVDRQADGGTHVHSTKEVGKLELVKIENKGKENRRLYFRVV